MMIRRGWRELRVERGPCPEDYRSEWRTVYHGNDVKTANDWIEQFVERGCACTVTFDYTPVGGVQTRRPMAGTRLRARVR